MTKKKTKLFGTVVLAKSPWSKDPIIRDLPSFAKTKKPSTTRQLLQWMHQALVAHGLQGVTGKASYPGLDFEIPAIAVALAYLRQRTIDMQKNKPARYAKLGETAAAIIAESTDIPISDALARVGQIPPAPNKLTAQEKRLAQIRKADQRWQGFVNNFSNIYNTLLKEPEEVDYYQAYENAIEKMPATGAKFAAASADEKAKVEASGRAFTEEDPYEMKAAAPAALRSRKRGRGRPARRTRTSLFDDDEFDSFF